MKPSVIFLDRDGTLIEDTHYPRDAERIFILPKVIDALKKLNELKVEIFVVSNQSGVGRGIISEKEFSEVSEKVSTLLEKAGIKIQNYFYCKHAPETDCACRKPKTGLIPASLQWSKAWMVGDTLADVELGKNLGIKSYLVRTGKGEATEKKYEAELKLWNCSVEDNLFEVVEQISKEMGTT